MKSTILLLACLMSIAYGQLPSPLTMKWEIISASAASSFCCNTYAPTNQLFFCLAYAAANNQPNFFTFDANGNAQQFTPAVGYGHLEMKPATVKLAPNSPFPFSGWILGDIYFPHVSGTIMKITGTTDISQFVHIVEEGHMTNEVVFDDTGSVYGADLLVTFNQSVYRVPPSGAYSLIVRDSGLKNYEGLVVVPNNVTRYGGLAGNILIPQTANPAIVATQNGPSVSNAGISIAAISPNLKITYITTPCHVDTLYIVKRFDQLFALDNIGGSTYFSSWDNLAAQGFEGKIMVQCEYPESGSPTGFYNLEWDANAKAAGFVPVRLDGASPATPSKWEHFCVSRGGTANQLPGGFSFCYWTNLNGGSVATKYGSYRISNTIAQNWNYLGGGSVSFPSTGLPAATTDTMTISIVQDSQNLFYLQVVIGPSSGAAYSPSLQILYSSPSFTDTNFLLRIQDTPTDTYFWDGSNGQFTWASYSSGNRGLVLGPMAHIPAMVPFSLNMKVSNVPNIVITSTTGGSTSFNAGGATTSFSINRVSCTCGNGIIDDPTLKQCDLGSGNNGGSQVCCTQDCQLRQTNYICNASSGSLCDAPSSCDGVNSTCPPKPFVPQCNCTFPFTGFNCLTVRCDLVTDCNTCNNFTQCQFCCGGSGGGGVCVAAGSCGSAGIFPPTCPSCPACANGGTCACGQCVCQPGFGGTTCNQTVDCTGTIPPAGQPPKVIDACGICGGNGTTCIGCDGKPYGLSYDNCGVCGGNGSSCFNPCAQPPTCQDCIEISVCGWCLQDTTSTKGSCINKDQNPSGCHSNAGFSKDCTVPPNKVVLAAGISAGVVAAIAIGVAIAVAIGIFGGKKGYDAYMANKNNLHGAQNNPMYNDAGRSGRNPMYELKGNA